MRKRNDKTHKIASVVRDNIKAENKEDMKQLKKLIRLDDNLISFLCGIISNIPISLLFTIQVWDDDWKNIVLFFLWVAAFIFAVLVTIFAFAFTIEKIRINKEVEAKNGDSAKDEALKDLLNNIHKSKRGKETKKSTVFYRRIICFITFLIILFLCVIALWVFPIIFKYI